MRDIISTHSLTKRLTKGRLNGTYNNTISTHSLTKRLTISPDRNLLIQIKFQLTASRRGWLGTGRRHDCTSGISTHSLTKRLTLRNATAESIRCISTHSLTKRLTRCRPGTVGEDRHFNSQPHEEADSINVRRIEPIWYFNSQPHEEADLNWKAITVSIMYFNSQPHEEADATYTGDMKNVFLFQLTASRRGWQRLHPWYARM